MALRKMPKAKSPHADHKAPEGGMKRRGPISTSTPVAKTKEGRNNSPDNGKFNTVPKSDRF